MKMFLYVATFSYMLIYERIFNLANKNKRVFFKASHINPNVNPWVPDGVR